jgi:hypothetical protein
VNGTSATLPASTPEELFLADRIGWEAFALRYHLAVPDRHRSARAGDLAGRRTGSSVEFQDRKDFVPGDDLRHVDWRGYARNDRMTVKLFREEITPVVDIIIDGSASMSVTVEKAARRAGLGYLFSLLSRKLHAMVRVHRVSDRLVRLYSPEEILQNPDTRYTNPLLPLAGSAAARPGGIKIFISDFLFPLVPSDLINCFRGADRVVAIQVLSSFENDPEVDLAVGAMLRLEDAEADFHLDVRLDRNTIDGYRKRLAALRSGLDQALRGTGGCFAVALDNESLDDTARKLLESGALAI